MEKILQILVPGYTYLYIVIFENTYIFIICHKKWNYSMFKKNPSLELFGSVFLWLIIFVKKVSLFINILINIYLINLYFISLV